MRIAQQIVITMHRTLLPTLILAAAAGLLTNAGCGGASDDGSHVDTGPADTTGPEKDPAAVGEGLPCDVADVIAQECVSCHGDPPTGGSPMSLLTYDDFMAPSLSDPSKTLAEVSLERMVNADTPMPPGVGASADAVAVFQAWLDAGLPKADPNAECGPVSVELTCTSGSYYTGGDDGEELMHPGGACLDCHAQEQEGPSLTLAGTVFPSLHEEVDCNGLGGITVEIVDAVDRVYTLTTNSAGNFLLEDEDEWPITFPIRASVSQGGQTLTMQDPVDSGDCNTCHSATGAEGAPGRIVAP
jgi:hypothetical protein